MSFANMCSKLDYSALYCRRTRRIKKAQSDGVLQIHTKNIVSILDVINILNPLLQASIYLNNCTPRFNKLLQEKEVTIKHIADSLK